MGSVIVGGRFQLYEVAGAGGMGVVRRGVDLSTGAPVAVKLLHLGQAPDRFLREAAVLAQLNHPAIVRYVAHGATEQGRLYLAMEWLEGKTLSELLSQRRLSPREVLTLGRRLAAGLAAAHRAGVVHRDLKPSNIFLPQGKLAEAKLLDFGVARRLLDPHFTQPGALIGTFAYMSPEQAAGERNPTSASDVFSLGSLLYRCITGELPFGGGDATAVLGKILLERAGRASEREPRTPPALDALIARLLEKRPEARPLDGSAVEELMHTVELDGERASGAPPALGSAEQRAVWVLLLGDGRAHDGDTRVARMSQPDLDPSVRTAGLVAQNGGRWDVLADGTCVATFEGAGSERGEAAIRVAKEIAVLWPERRLALAHGLGVVAQSAPVGQALDRAAAALAKGRAGSVRVDAETARSLDGQRMTEVAPGIFEVGREDAPGKSGTRDSRRLLGRETPCVGRDSELVSLEALLDESIEERVARAVVVVGPAGIGKSRVRYELLRRVAERHPHALVLLGRAESVSAGSPFGLLREALRRAASILDGEPIAESRDKLRRLVAPAFDDPARGEEVTATLGELAHVAFDDSALPALAAARADPTLMGDALRAAWLDFVAALCRKRPLVLVLEDLHWGDRPTVSLLDAALAAHHESPFSVVALARPEVYEVLPKLWAERDVHEIRLRPLHRAASEALARSVLRDDVDPALITRIVETAEGNAFFLEELIRAVAEGKQTLPATVMGVVQARLDELEAHERRILRAASVFGARFWRGGVAALLGGGDDARDASDVLDTLVVRELLSKRATAAFPGESEYVFRHAVVRETAYASLTAEDRRLGHRLAAGFLERAGGVDALTLAEHFRLGEAREHAMGHYLTAAEEALEGHDLSAALARAELALECRPNAAARGHLRQLQAHIHVWKGEYARAEQEADEALALLPEGSARWFAALSDHCTSASCLNHWGLVEQSGSTAFAAAATGAEARAAKIMCLSRVATANLKAGRRAVAEAAIANMGDPNGDLGALSDVARAWAHHARSALAYFSGEPSQFRLELETAMKHFDAAGDRRAATNARVNLGFVLATLGDYGRASELLARARETALRLGLDSIRIYAQHNLAWIAHQRGEHGESAEQQRLVVAAAAEQGEDILEGSARAYYALALCAAGRAEEALAEARQADEILSGTPGLRPLAGAAEARALLALGKAKEAVGVAQRAFDRVAGADTPEDTEALVRLTHAEALEANGAHDAAVSAIADAVRRLEDRAALIGDAELERTFTTRVPDHVRTLELAAKWGARG